MGISTTRYKNGLWVALILIILLLLWLVPSISDVNKSATRDDKTEIRRYKMLGIDSKREVKGVVLAKHCDEEILGREVLYVDLSNNIQFSLYLSTENREYSPSNLLEFIELGDSIYKAGDSNKLTVSRNGTEYYFRLGEIIGKKHKIINNSEI